MQRDSVIIFTVAVIVTAGIFLSAHLYQKHQLQAAESANQAAPDPAQNTAPEPAIDVGNFAYLPDTTRTSQIIECHDPEVGTFYTNAAECAGADLENKLSDYQPLRTPSIRPKSQRSSGSRNGSRTNNNQNSEPSLRLAGKSPPSGLPPECKFPVGKALELERPLSAADDPYQSIWRKDYCRWRCEARKERCPVSPSLYSYNYDRMCRDTAYSRC